MKPLLTLGSCVLCSGTGSYRSVIIPSQGPWQSGAAGTELIRPDPGMTRGQAVADAKYKDPSFRPSGPRKFQALQGPGTDKAILLTTALSMIFQLQGISWAVTTLDCGDRVPVDQSLRGSINQLREIKTPKPPWMTTAEAPILLPSHVHCGSAALFHIIFTPGPILVSTQRRGERPREPQPALRSLLRSDTVISSNSTCVPSNAQPSG